MKWGLGEGAMSPDMQANYIEFNTTSTGESVALKIGIPNSEMFTEMESLRLYNGRKAVRFLDADRHLGAILMQRIQPGTMLWVLGDDQQEAHIAGSVMRGLPVPVPAVHILPRYSAWVERAFRLTRTEWDPEELMPRDLIDKAETALASIQMATTNEVVLHGDLHQENILLDDDSRWTAIDPKGVIGPPCLEVGRFLQNRLPSTLPTDRREKMVHERLDILSYELGYPRDLLAACGLVDCVLSKCWHFEEEGQLNNEWYAGIDLARLFADLAGA
jgi:streptomycin 6-kinase